MSFLTGTRLPRCAKVPDPYAEMPEARNSFAERRANRDVIARLGHGQFERQLSGGQASDCGSAPWHLGRRYQALRAILTTIAGGMNRGRISGPTGPHTGLRRRGTELFRPFLSAAVPGKPAQRSRHTTEAIAFAVSDPAAYDLDISAPTKRVFPSRVSFKSTT